MRNIKAAKGSRKGGGTSSRKKKGARKNQRKTPKSKIKSLLQRLFLWSRERGYVVKTGTALCQNCGSDQGRKKDMHVHHVKPTDWQRIYDIIYQELLVPPEEMVLICKNCHSELHKREYV